MVHRRSDSANKTIALERIGYLQDLARRYSATSPELSARYVTLSERIARRMDITLPQAVKRSYCKKCGHSYSYRSRVRIKKGICLVTCGFCGDIRRIPYKI